MDMKKTIMSNLTNNIPISADSNQDDGSFEGAVGMGHQSPLDKSRQPLDEEELTSKNGSLLGGKAEKYIRDSANIEDLPGDDDDDLDDDEADEIDLNEELEIETDEVDVESIEIDDEDPDDIIEEDDNDLNDDDDIL